MRRRRVWYYVTNFSHYWWQRGKWILELDNHYGASTHARAKTLKQAIRIARKCPAEMIIVKFYLKHGERWSREIVLLPEGGRE